MSVSQCYSCLRVLSLNTLHLTECEAALICISEYFPASLYVSFLLFYDLWSILDNNCLVLLFWAVLVFLFTEAFSRLKIELNRT